MNLMFGSLPNTIRKAEESSIKRSITGIVATYWLKDTDGIWKKEKRYRPCDGIETVYVDVAMSDSTAFLESVEVIYEFKEAN